MTIEINIGKTIELKYIIIINVSNFLYRTHRAYSH